MTHTMRPPITLLLTIILMAGCATHPPHTPTAPRPNPSPVPRATTPPPMPEAGYTWQDLARHAIAANPDHAAILADARAEYFRYKSRTDLQDLRLSLDYTSRNPDDDRYSANLRFYIPNPFVDKHLLRTGEAAALEIKGRHDPCIVPRAVPCIEAAAAIALVDAILDREGNKPCN